MFLKELQFEYPSELIATKPSAEFRTMLSDGDDLSEISKSQIFDLFQPGDILVINETRVVKRRLFSKESFEVLFLQDLGDKRWSVMFPASRLKKNQKLHFAEGLTLSLVKSGLPQTVELNFEIDDTYFEKYGEMALPPYIQKARGERKAKSEDEAWYQTEWAKHSGSCAAPTASLHFSNQDLEFLNKEKGIVICPVTLHVGLGTFSPIRVEDLSDHKMHSEYAEISSASRKLIKEAKASGGRVWALGTTVTRTLESWGAEKLTENSDGGLSGSTDLFIQPGFEFKIVDVLMTNFHQPESSLLALVSGFAGYEKVMKAYKWAIKNNFKLFSYGDLSLWM